jgi:hypothetical protein
VQRARVRGDGDDFDCAHGRHLLRHVAAPGPIAGARTASHIVRTSPGRLK